MERTLVGSIILTVLDFTAVVNFLIGGLLFLRITKKYGNKASSIFALLGTVSCFVGGFPNAVDKFHRIIDSDTVFNSNWMFLFVGMGFTMLFLSVFLLGQDRKKTPSADLYSVALPILVVTSVSMMPKHLKIVFMLLATVGMLGYYPHTYRLAKKHIGNHAIWYIVSVVMALSMSVISVICKNFYVNWPNIIAQVLNNVSHIGFIVANSRWLRKLSASTDSSPKIS